MRKLYWRGRNFRDLRRAINEPWQDWADNVFEVTSGEPAGFDPATLTGIIGVYDVSDLSSMTVGRDGSGGTPGVGDPVGTLADQSVAGNDLAAPSDAARPVLRQTGGGLYYLEHDGVDDKLESASITTVSAPIYVACAVAKAAEDAKFFPGVHTDLSNYLSMLNVASAGQERSQGALRTTALGIKLTPHTLNTFPVDTPTVIEYLGSSSGLDTWINGGDQKTNAFAGFTGLSNAVISTTTNSIGHDFYGGVFRAGTANAGTDQADIRTWLSDLSGATLA